MFANLAIIFSTAVLSSLFTLLTVYILYKIRLKEKLKSELDELALLMKARLKEGVEEAGKELLPRFREEVKEGFKEAMKSAVSGEMNSEFVSKTAQTAVETGSSIVESGLNFLLGNNMDNPDSEEEKGRKK